MSTPQHANCNKPHSQLSYTLQSLYWYETQLDSFKRTPHSVWQHCQQSWKQTATLHENNSKQLKMRWDYLVHTLLSYIVKYFMLFPLKVALCQLVSPIKRTCDDDEMTKCSANKQPHGLWWTTSACLKTCLEKKPKMWYTNFIFLTN